MQINVRGNSSHSTKDVTDKLDAKLVDLQKKAVPLSGISTVKSAPVGGTQSKPLKGTLSSCFSQIDMDLIVDTFESNVQTSPIIDSPGKLKDSANDT